MYSREEVYNATLKYFKGDELATNVWINKYALKDSYGNIFELTPDDMHHRIAKELARIEKKYPNSLSEETIYKLLKDFKYIVPQGSPMAGIGNDLQIASLSNCYVISDENIDSYGGIMRTDEEQVQLMKRRAGVGHDLSGIRPKGSPVKNSALTSTGVVPFMERYSNTTREAAQCIEENQRVLTRRGLIPIKNIVAGKRVWTRKGWVKVEKVLENGKKSIYNITTKFGHSIKCTKDHLFVSCNEHGSIEKTINEIGIGGPICLLPGTACYQRPIQLSHTKFNKTIRVKANHLGTYGVIEHNRYNKCTIPKELDGKLAYLIGYLHGNGCTYKRGESAYLSVSVNSKDTDIIDKVTNYTTELFGLKKSHKGGNGNWTVIRVGNSEICSFLEENGLEKNKSKSLFIPSIIFHAGSSLQASYLSGLFDADGYASGPKKGYVFSTASKRLADDISVLLLANGIMSKIHIEKDRGESWSDIYSVSVVGAISQKRLVEFCNYSEKIKTSAWVSKRDNYLSPYTSCQLGISHNKYSFIPDCNNFISINALSRCQEYTGEVLIQDYIEKIEYVGELPTYDLQLEEEHLFFCEGFYVHNSGRRGALMLTISIDHPDSEDFIDAKLEKGKVTGANISVKITDAFMEAALKGEKYGLKFPINSDNPKYTKEIDASKLWNKIIHNAWKSAEPGVLFWDTLIRESVPDCYEDMGFKTISTNPCLTGDTYVALTNGKNVTMRELAEVGEDVEVFTLDHKGYICKRYLRSPRITGYNEKIYKLVLDDESEVRTTGNHKFRLYNGQYKEVKDLKNTDILFTFPIIYNLGIKEVVEDGYENVYNGTVDDYHNFFVSGKDSNHFLNNLQCGELPLCGYDSCRLLVLNLYSYVNHPFTPGAYFNYELFRQHVGYAQRFMDDIIDLEIEKIEAILAKIESDPESDDIKEVEKKLWLKIKDKCLKGRRTGLGITALGDMLAAMGLKYGSKSGNDMAEEVQEELAGCAYKESNLMASERGCFPIYNSELEKNNPFLRRIGQTGYERRNIALLTIAPTGSVSILTQTTSGIEPAFMVSYKRRRKVNPSDKDVNITFVDEVGDSWEEYHVFHHKFITWLEVNGYNVEEVMKYNDGALQEVIMKSPYYKATANDIDWVSKVQMQGLVQKYVDHSISVTVNVPHETSVDMVKSIYEAAWKAGCKGCTIYRDGSRSGVLVSDSSPKLNKFGYLDAVKRPKELDARLHIVTANGERYGVLVGLLDDNPYEIFAFPASSYSKADGKIIKVKKGEYRFNSEEFEINNLETAALYPEGQVLTRLVSGLLRHGTNPYFIIEQIDKTPLEIVSFGKVLSRVLKTYIKEDSLKGKLKCNDCGSTNVSLQEGCLMCNDCGSSKCG